MSPLQIASTTMEARIEVGRSGLMAEVAGGVTVERLSSQTAEAKRTAIDSTTHARGKIVEVYGRLDVRNLSLAFLNEIVGIARRRRLLIVTEDRHILRPTMKELLAAIHRSSSFAFVSDPDGFLARLADAD